jgi:3-oxoacyl-(acyl-carrier-protein) synthase
MGLDVAVTGVGVVSALGMTPAELVDRLIADDLGIQETPWTREDPDQFEFWAPVENFAPPPWMAGKLDGIDPFARHAGGPAPRRWSGPSSTWTSGAGRRPRPSS